MAKRKIINRSNSDLIGNNFTNVSSETIFSLGDFSVGTNFSKKVTKDFSESLSSFTKTFTLDELELTDDQSVKLNSFTTSLKLNIDRGDLGSYVRFGSTYDRLNSAIGGVIKKYPASLFLYETTNVGVQNTIIDYDYNFKTDIATFKVPSIYIVNKFGLSIDDGNFSVGDDETELSNLNLSFRDYVIWRKDDPSNNKHSIIEFTGDTASKAWLDVKVKGNPFPTAATSSESFSYHIKPSPLKYNEVREGLGDLESFLIKERLEGQTGFTIRIKEPVIYENGKIKYNYRNLKWSTTDGYNLDTTGGEFERFVKAMLGIGSNFDNVKTDLINRMLVPKSFLKYDQTDEQKAEKLLRIYGREFDNVREFIDALADINTVTYDKINNAPDLLIKNLAATLGWEYFDIVSEKEFIGDVLNPQEKNDSLDLSISEINIELWRRILINTISIWKGKGTRNALRSVLGIIGIPDPFINISEYVYVAENVIDPTEQTLTLEDLPSASLPYSTGGYPIAPQESNSFYYQSSGDSDNGQTYINLYRNVGFNLSQYVDNKKSWVYEEVITERAHSTTPNYFQNDSRLIVNTKEIEATLDTSRGLEWDVFKYNKDIDFPISSSGFTRPNIYINIAIDYGQSSDTFTIPEDPLGDIQVSYNGLTLNKGVGENDGDYYINGNNSREVILNNDILAYNNGGTDIDYITLTYLNDQDDGVNGDFSEVSYVIQKPVVSSGGTLITLPEEPRGDIQLVVDNVTLTKGTDLINGDFIINPVNRTQILVKSQGLAEYLQTNDNIRISYIVAGDDDTISTRSEAHRVDNLSSSKFYYNVGINRNVYVLDFKAIDINSIKITVNGLTLQNGSDFVLDGSNKSLVILPPNISFGDIIGAYYVIGDSNYSPPLIPENSGIPDITGLSFLEYLELITRKLINVKTTKTVTNHEGGFYPTVLKVYEDYLKRSKLEEGSSLKSNGYVFNDLNLFIERYSSHFQKFVDQLLPTTIIQRKSGVLIRNSAFTRQKHKYLRGVNFDPELGYLGDDGQEFVRKITPSEFEWKNDTICKIE